MSKSSCSTKVEYQYYEENSLLETGRTIHEEYSSSIATGLLDINGNELYRIKYKEPVGFRCR